MSVPSHRPNTLQAPEKVLVVDDDEAFRRTMVRTLGRAGYACEEASGVAEAVAVLEGDEPMTAVLCDVQMPGESGLDLVRRISWDHPDVAVVMTTGDDNPVTAGAAFEFGADAYLVKPFTTNEILITLSGAVRRRALEAARRDRAAELQRSLARAQAVQRIASDLSHGDLPVGTDLAANLLDRLSRAVSLRDDETGWHIERMSRYAELLVAALDGGRWGGEAFRLAAAMHDVGKIAVPDFVLSKPGPLAPDERIAMQRHALAGYQMLAGASSELLMAAANIARSHHEWWDGGGYPAGQGGEDIPREARIAAVADVFDALTSHRVYRPALTVDDAVTTMTELRGRQFEPAVLDRFFELLDDVLAVRNAFPDEEPTQRIRVLLVDDEEIFVHSLARLLGGRPTLRVVGTASTVAEAVSSAVTYEPDVVLMDFELPDGEGATATRAIKQRLPGTKVVMLTGREDRQALVRSVAAGCSGFVRKTDPVETLLAAIVAAHEGEISGDVLFLPDLMRELPSSHRGLGGDLRPRELEVLRLMAAGIPNKAIAQQLVISLNTVRNHVQAILGKLDAHSKLEAVAVATREGLIERETGTDGQ